MPTYYQSPPGKRMPLNIRVPASLRAKLLDIVQLWRATAEVEGDNPDGLDLTFVCERLLTAGSDEVWTEAGHKAGIGSDRPPSNEAERQRIINAVRAAGGGMASGSEAGPAPAGQAASPRAQ